MSICEGNGVLVYVSTESAEFTHNLLIVVMEYWPTLVGGLKLITFSRSEWQHLSHS